MDRPVWFAILAWVIATTSSVAAPIVRSVGGSNDTASIQAAVDAFRADLGALNPNEPGSFLAGRREVNWDAVPDDRSATNHLPADFFNAPSAPRARGVVFATPGPGFEVSADSTNANATPTLFGNINPDYTNTFRAFSPAATFTVTNTAPSGLGSLEQAILDANDSPDPTPSRSVLPAAECRRLL